MSNIKYSDDNVLIAAKKRISMIFDNFENIMVSISGGKDSTVLCHLCLMEARKRSRKINIFFLDEEIMYDSTIKQVEYLMSLYPENTNRLWLQVPFKLTNSVSFSENAVLCWDKEKKPVWMHKRNKKNILTYTWTHKTKILNKDIGLDFYSLLYNFELSFNNVAHLVGLRAVESPNRWRTMVKNPGYKDVYWSTKRDGKENYTFYPIYDWLVSDIWRYIYDNELKYHPYYDFCFKKGMHPHLMRVSSLVHEKSFKSIQDLPEFEFDTYEKLLKRTKGISFAQETAKDRKMFKAQELPKQFKSWIEYKESLLKSYPDESKKNIFIKRFSKHLKNEFVARQQCRQLILNDYENNLPIKNTEDPFEEKLKYWIEIL